MTAVDRAPAYRQVAPARVARQTRSIRCPTLVIDCAHDQIVTQTSELAASIPRSTYQQIGAGHLAYFEAAGEFLSLADEFLRRQ